MQAQNRGGKHPRQAGRAARKQQGRQSSAQAARQAEQRASSKAGRAARKQQGRQDCALLSAGLVSLHALLEAPSCPRTMEHSAASEALL